MDVWKKIVFRTSFTCDATEGRSQRLLQVVAGEAGHVCSQTEPDHVHMQRMESEGEHTHGKNSDALTDVPRVEISGNVTRNLGQRFPIH